MGTFKVDFPVHSKYTEFMNGLNKAIDKQGGLTALANALGLSKGVIFQWKVRGRVPGEWCPEVEKLTGVLCEELNDKIDWAYVRENGRRKALT